MKGGDQCKDVRELRAELRWQSGYSRTDSYGSGINCVSLQPLPDDYWGRCQPCTGKMMR